MRVINSILGILYKEYLSEVRSTYYLFTVAIYSIITIIIGYLAMHESLAEPSAFTAVLWIVIFFISMNTLPRSFITDEESNVSILLSLSTSPLSIYFGKLIYNIINNLLLLVITLVGMLWVSEIVIKDMLYFWLNAIFVCISFASAGTILSAIIAKSSKRGALLPLLALPILMPIILLGIDTSISCIYGVVVSFLDISFILLYSVVLVALSALLFDFVWLD